MKRTLFKIALACLAFATVSGLALAQVNQLSDPGFEGELGQKLTNFANFNAAGFWLDDGVNYTNTGYEVTGAHSGVERAYEMSGDDGAYQVESSYLIQNGDQITLTWWALATSDPSNGTNPPEQVVGLVKCPIQYPANGPGVGAFGSCTPLAVTSNGLSGGWVQYTLNYTAGLSDVGNYLGCYFNTTNAYGFVSNSFGGYDDFYMAVIPAGSEPSITVEPASQTAYTGATVTFAVSAVGATSYQWMAGVTGSGIYTNLLNAGQFSGVNTPELTITNAQPTNTGDYVVVVSNGNGSVTSSPPANLTVATLIYEETFSVPTKPDQQVANVGWINDISGNNNRLFTGNGGVTFPVCAVYSYNGVAGSIESFYATTASANGGPYDNGTVTNKMAFGGINLAAVQNLTFSVSMNVNGGGTWNAYIEVQLNNSQWYVSTNGLTPQPGSQVFVTDTLKFNPSAANWKFMTNSGIGSYYSSYSPAEPYPAIGPAATANLTGYITGVGIVFQHLTAGDVQFNNYIVAGATPPSVLPVISSPPTSMTNYTGTTAKFTVSANSNSITSGLTYQWQTNTAVGSGTWANLSDGGQFSGSTSSSLAISNVTSAANHKDYRVIVTDGAGSTTSTPPATLTVSDSAPLLTVNTIIYPNAATAFGTNNSTIEAGNNNTLNMTASFAGDLPINYHWQVSPNSNGSGAVNVPNATNAILTLSNPQTNASGYYSLQASNSQTITPTNSAWVQLTVLSATNAFIQWSAPVNINPTPTTALTAAQILGGVPGTYFEAESFGASSVVNVTNGGTVYIFDNTGASATTAANGRTLTGAYTGPTTGDPNLDIVLGTDQENTGGATVTLNNLAISQLYSVQMFALNDTAGSAREANFSNSGDTADVSASFAMGDNVYLVGTFTATNTTQTIIENEADGHGYITAVIVRQVPPTPTVSIQKVGASLQVNFGGMLLQSTNVTGPWTTNNTTSPYTFTPTSKSMFFRAVSP